MYDDLSLSLSLSLFRLAILFGDCRFRHRIFILRVSFCFYGGLLNKLSIYNHRLFHDQSRQFLVNDVDFGESIFQNQAYTQLQPSCHEEGAIIALTVTIVMSVLFTSASELGYRFFKKTDRLLITRFINVPIMLSCFILFFLSIRKLTRLKSTMLTSLPSGFQAIIRISKLHLMAISVVALPCVVVFMVRRFGYLSKHNIVLSFYWCFSFRRCFRY